MTFLSVLEVFNYALVLLFGLFLSVFVAGGWKDRQQKRIVFILCPVFLLIQCICWLIWGAETVEKIYPLIVHLPLVLILVFALKKRFGVSLVSVCTAYLCCQLPYWVRLTASAISGSALVGEICYTLFIFPIFFLLHYYFVRTAHEAMTYSSRLLVLFGSLPLAYYLFDYAAVVYSDALYVGVPALIEFFPTAIIVFYVVFLTAYHAQTQKRTQAELHSSLLEAELRQSGTEIESLRRAETQTAIYQHDMRHHLTVIEGFLTAGKPRQAEEYIKKVQADVDAITPKRFCENETVNLLCSAFADRAEKLGISLTVDAKLPRELFITDTELCSLLSNGLENALHAVTELEQPLNWVNLYCGVRMSKLLIEIKNPFAGEITMHDGLPVSAQKGHGYGCRSIRTITEQHRGLYTFEAENGIFTLRVVLPVHNG